MSENPWPEAGRGRTKAERERKAHSVAARIGWAYRRDRKKGPSSPMEYLRSVKLTERDLRRYRMARKTSPERLLVRRLARKRRTGKPRTRVITRPFLVNSWDDNAHAYREFVAQYIRRRRPRSAAEARAMMRRAALAWRTRRGVAANELPGTVYFDDNPLYRDPMGRFTGRPVPGARLLRRRRGRYGGWRNPYTNPVLPQMAWDNNERRHRRRRRLVLRNAVLPYAAFNPGASDNPFEALGGAIETTFTMDFWSDTVLPIGAGFIGGQFAGGLIYGLVEKIAPSETVTGKGFIPSIARIGSRALGSAAVSGLAFFVTKDTSVAEKVLAGGLVSVLTSIIQEIFGKATYEKITGMADISDVAQDLTEELKERIAESVRREIAKSETGTQGVSAFVTTQDLMPAPTLGPGPRVQGIDSFVTTEELSTAPVATTAPSGPPMVADISAFSDTFADMMLV